MAAYTKITHHQSNSTMDIDQDFDEETQIQMATLFEEESKRELISIEEDKVIPNHDAKTPTSPSSRSRRSRGASIYLYKRPKSVHNLNSMEFNINAILQQDLDGNPKSWDSAKVESWFNFHKLQKFKKIFHGQYSNKLVIGGKELLLITNQKLFEGSKYRERVANMKITPDDQMTIKFFR